MLICLVLFFGYGFYSHAADAHEAKKAGKSTTWTQVKDGK
jgi:hypothetical protein